MQNTPEKRSAPPSPVGTPKKPKGNKFEQVKTSLDTAVDDLDTVLSATMFKLSQGKGHDAMQHLSRGMDLIAKMKTVLNDDLGSLAQDFDGANHRVHVLRQRIVGLEMNQGLLRQRLDKEAKVKKLTEHQEDLALLAAVKQEDTASTSSE